MAKKKKEKEDRKLIKQKEKDAKREREGKSRKTHKHTTMVEDYSNFLYTSPEKAKVTVEEMKHEHKLY